MMLNGCRPKLLTGLLVLIAVCVMPVVANALPAFPGAEGWGSDTVGGRGGTVYFVTNTNNSGPGSLRAALEASGPRIVVFRTGGTVTLTSPLKIQNPYITIAGQTAPGDGFQVRGSGESVIHILTHDVIIRGLRIRSEGGDALDPNGPAYNVIIDHNSLSWGDDTVTGTYSNAHHITWSWNVINEGLSSGKHSAGMLINGMNNCSQLVSHISIHHNLFAHNHIRSPVIKHLIVSPEVVNNLIYNWGQDATDIMSEAYVAKNHYIPGNNSASGTTAIKVRHAGECPSLQPGTVMVSHNIGPGRTTDTGDDWNIVSGGSSIYRTDSPPFPLSGINEDDVSDVYGKILSASSGAGAIVPSLDTVDARIRNDVINRTGSIKSSVSQAGGFPTLFLGTPPTDTDNDGMPDSWEISHGTNQNVADDDGDLDGDGYTNIEEYINGLILAVGAPSPRPNTQIPNPPSNLSIR